MKKIIGIISLVVIAFVLTVLVLRKDPKGVCAYNNKLNLGKAYYEAFYITPSSTSASDFVAVENKPKLKYSEMEDKLTGYPDKCDMESKTFKAYNYCKLSETAEKCNEILKVKFPAKQDKIQIYFH